MPRCDRAVGDADLVDAAAVEALGELTKRVVAPGAHVGDHAADRLVDLVVDDVRANEGRVDVGDGAAKVEQREHECESS